MSGKCKDMMLVSWECRVNAGRGRWFKPQKIINKMTLVSFAVDCECCVSACVHYFILCALLIECATMDHHLLFDCNAAINLNYDP